MIDGVYYHPIYLIIVTLFSLAYYLKYASFKHSFSEKSIVAVILSIVFSFFIGFRPPHNVFYDTVGLVHLYKSYANEVFKFTLDTENFIFDNVLGKMSSLGFHYSIWLIFIASIFFIGYYIALKKLFDKNVTIAYIIFLGSFITFSSATNGFKAGAAASFFVCAIAYKDKLKVAIPLLLLTIGFHHAMFVCLIAYILVYFYKNLKLYYFIWIVSLLLALFKVTYFQTLFNNFSFNDKANMYLNLGSEGWRTGMRYDFVLYSSIPIIQSWFHIKRYRILSDKYSFILNLYILLNSIWLLCMYANFTNRIAALSWALYPIVILLPYMEKNKNTGEYVVINRNKKISSVLLYNLLFTLFMQVIYYGLIKTIK